MKIKSPQILNWLLASTLSRVPPNWLDALDERRMSFGQRLIRYGTAIYDRALRRKLRRKKGA